MTRVLKVLRAGQLRDLRSPRVHTGGEWRKAHTVYRKEAGEWVEWWPLKPDPPINVRSFFIFRNQRMELDIDWDVPTGTRPVPDMYDIQVDVAAGRDLQAYTYLNSAVETFLNPDRAWDSRSGLMTITVWGVYSHSGVRSDPVTLGPLSIQRPPQPPPPVATTTAINPIRFYDYNNRHKGAIITVRLNPAEVGTDYILGVRSTLTEADGSTYTAPAIAGRVTPIGGGLYEVDLGRVTSSLNGGVLGIVTRSEAGVSGLSSPWVPYYTEPSYVTTWTQPPTPVFQPPPGTLVPGISRIVGHQFKDGRLECGFEVPFAPTAKAWWQVEGGPLVALPDQAASGAFYSGKIVVADSVNWLRDGRTRYRIVVQGVTSTGALGDTALGPWATKLPNPYYLEPTGSAALRNGLPDSEHTGEYIRQGTSNDTGTPTKWTGLLFYDQNELSERRIGYTVNVSDAKAMVRRHENSTPRYGVPPVVRTHGYDTPNQASTNLSGDRYSAGRFVSQTPGEYRLQQLTRQTAADIIDPSVATVNGIAVRDGQGGNEALMVYHGLNHTIEGRKAWTIQITHDG